MQAKGYAVKNELLYKEVDQELLMVVPEDMQLAVIRGCHEQDHFGRS